MSDVSVPGSRKNWTMENLAAVLGPFFYDGRIGSPTSEAIANDCLAKDPEAAMRLKGKVAVVTGTTLGGIGAHTASILAGKVGMHVVCTGRSQSKIDACVETLKEDYPDALLEGMMLDVSSFASVRTFVQDFETKFPPDRFELVLLVNNAGLHSHLTFTVPSLPCPSLVLSQPPARFRSTSSRVMRSTGIMNPPYSQSVDGIEMQMATNHLGLFPRPLPVSFPNHLHLRA